MEAIFQKKNDVALKYEECIPIDLRNATRDATKENRTGLGIGKNGAPANTLTQGAVPGVFYDLSSDKVGCLMASDGGYKLDHQWVVSGKIIIEKHLKK